VIHLHRNVASRSSPNKRVAIPRATRAATRRPQHGQGVQRPSVARVRAGGPQLVATPRGGLDAVHADADAGVTCAHTPPPPSAAA
jgi:hypothetical protein